MSKKDRNPFTIPLSSPDITDGLLHNVTGRLRPGMDIGNGYGILPEAAADHDDGGHGHHPDIIVDRILHGLCIFQAWP